MANVEQAAEPHCNLFEFVSKCCRRENVFLYINLPKPSTQNLYVAQVLLRGIPSPQMYKPTHLAFILLPNWALPKHIICMEREKREFTAPAVLRRDLEHQISMGIDVRSPTRLTVSRNRQLAQRRKIREAVLVLCFGRRCGPRH